MHKNSIKRKANTCPFCGSHDIDEDMPDTDITSIENPQLIATQLCKCFDCGTIWQDIYTYQHSQVVSYGEPTDETEILL